MYQLARVCAGDIVPRTAMGRGVALVVSYIGVFSVALLAGTLFAWRIATVPSECYVSPGFELKKIWNIIPNQNILYTLAV